MKRYLIRIEPFIFEELRKLAKAEERSINYLIVQAIKEKILSK